MQRIRRWRGTPEPAATKLGEAGCCISLYPYTVYPCSAWLHSVLRSAAALNPPVLKITHYETVWKGFCFFKAHTTSVFYVSLSPFFSLSQKHTNLHATSAIKALAVIHMPISTRLITVNNVLPRLPCSPPFPAVPFKAHTGNYDKVFFNKQPIQCAVGYAHLHRDETTLVLKRASSLIGRKKSHQVNTRAHVTASFGL